VFRLFVCSEDNWDEGDLHYQIYDGDFGFDINGNGDYVFEWQPYSADRPQENPMQPNQWYYITVIYSCADHVSLLSPSASLHRTLIARTYLRPRTPWATWIADLPPQGLYARAGPAHWWTG
jgi:hypothetical protein